MSDTAEGGEEVWRHRVRLEEVGLRLDHLLVSLWPERSRSWLQRMVREGRALLDGRRVKTGIRLEEGQEVELRPPPPTPSTVEPEDLPLRVRIETEHYLVVDKPAGMVVHPAAGHRQGTLVAALLHRYPRLSREGGPDRPGIVHRLDRDTSGLLVVARDDRSHRHLAEQFRRRSVRKRYAALVWGRLRESEGTIDRPVGRDPARRSRMTAGGLRSRPAETRWRVRESMPGFSLLDVDLRTGRTHQIRVHFSSEGYPIVGDANYGGRRWRGLRDPLSRKAVREFRRLALHAAHLEFDDPETGKRIAIDSPLPPGDGLPAGGASPMTSTREPSVALVGTGRVGTTLASLLGRAGYALEGLVDRSLRAARRAAGAANAGVATTSLRKGTKGAGLVLLAVPDRDLARLARALVPLGPWPGRVVLHTCGAEGPETLAPLAAVGAEVGALHPLQTFPSAERPLKSLRGVRAAVAGSEEATRVARGLCRRLGLRPLSVAEEGRALYHLGAVLASNHVVSLMDAAVEALAAAGLPRDEALASLLPLLGGARSALSERGLPGALTGPVARGDLGTLERHLAALGQLDPATGRLYRDLSRRALRLAREAGAVEGKRARRIEDLLAEKD